MFLSQALEDEASIDFGADGVLWPLKDKCITTRAAGYDYTVCPFKDAHQGEGGSKSKARVWPDESARSWPPNPISRGVFALSQLMTSADDIEPPIWYKNIRRKRCTTGSFQVTFGRLLWYFGTDAMGAAPEVV